MFLFGLTVPIKRLSYVGSDCQCGCVSVMTPSMQFAIRKIHLKLEGTSIVTVL